MRKSLLTTALLLAVGASPALAADTAIIMWNGANVVRDTGFGSVTLGPENLGGINVTLASVSRSSYPALNKLNEATFSLSNTTNSIQTLHIIAGANGYVGLTNMFSLTATVLASNGSVGLNGIFFADAGNTLNGTSETVTGEDIDNFNSLPLLDDLSFEPDTGRAGPYSLAERLDLTLAPGASVGVQGMSTQAIPTPEPSTWAMLLSGFGLMAALAFRRSRNNRLATI